MYEVPPTAGLPLRWQDLLPGSGQDLSTGLTGLVGLPAQVESSGTASLVVALAALRATSRRTRVVVPAYTCPLVPLAIRHAGLEVDVCDLEPDHFDLDPGALAARCGGDTLAIVPTHLGGRVADVAGAMRVANEVGASVIEDAAQALGARHGASPVGTLGDLGIFSLAAGKGLTTYEGGFVVARDPRVRAAIQVAGMQLRRRRPMLESWRTIELLAYMAGYNPVLLSLAYGWPLRRRLRRKNLLAAVGDDLDGPIPIHEMSRWRAAIAARALARLPAFQRRLESQAQSRCRRLRALPGVCVLVDAPGHRGVWPVLMVLMPGQVERDSALDKLWGAGQGVGRMFLSALPDYPYLQPIVTDAPVPNARSFAARLLTVSNSPWLSDERFDVVLAGIADAARTGHY